MTMSIDADCYALHEPGCTQDLQLAPGQGSPYHAAPRRLVCCIDRLNPQS